eukprot:CAMPEP_0194281798 /NCGR_PEP_ID=MMETSP0169-20130528/21597_1 /TAXON_ID=218684 /ORGANISM="Corethron pennatum, Strain L29A3" /LENGTH=314 /DNA_ID=CAMNT_0039026957 /DNA_START=74 /DNA_END=1018 /DNA_ORIENTATION=+
MAVAMRTVLSLIFSIVMRCEALLPSTLPIVDAETVARGLWERRDLYKTNVHGILVRGEGNPKFRLAYLPCRNRGEIIRIMLEEACCPYELEIVGFENWRDDGVKATTPHGKLPVLRCYDGDTDLGQEGAITRYLARQLGLAGRNPAEEAAVDSLYCYWFATCRNQGISHDGPEFSIAALRDVEDVAALARPRYKDVFRLNTLSRAERSLAALDFFEETLARSGGDFLVGNSPTVADCGLFYVLYELAEEDNVPGFVKKFNLPRLGAFLDAMAARPQIRAYLESPSRMPRYARDASGSSTYLYVPGRLSPDLSQA